MMLCQVYAAQGITAERIEYVIYDGQRYDASQIESAANQPVTSSAAYSSGNDYIIPQASDGHYYVMGFLNGFPIVFLIDTGASISAIPANLVRNTGIRAGRVVYTQTAAGSSRAGMSGGNVLQLGHYKLNDIKITVSEKLEMPLLGMDALSRFQISQSNRMMLLRSGR